MQQASNSLLTLCPIPFKGKPVVSVFLRDEARTNGCLLTPFHVCPETTFSRNVSVFPALRCPPRSSICLRLGEGRIRSLLFSMGLLICILWTQSGLGSDQFAVNLKEAVSIRSSTILIGDIADLQGNDKWAQKLAQIPIGSVPPFGVTATVSRHQVEEAVRKTGLLPEILFTGAAIVEVKLQGRQVQPEEVISLLRNYLSETTAWSASEIEIRSVGNLKDIEIPPGEAKLQIPPRLAVLGHGKILAPIEVLQGQHALRCFWIPAEVYVHTSIVTALKPIRAGQILESTDIGASPAVLTDLEAAYVRDPEEVLGKLSRRSFSPGDPLVREAISNPFLVRSGETVQLRLERNGIVLTSLARAEQDGRLGQVIKVRNLDFSTTLKARVTGRAEVRVQ
jgi:flagellar basal body P-ring formation protein FlgA